MDRWDSSCLAGLSADPAALAVEALELLGLPDSAELSALSEDGVKTFDAALAVGQPAVLADFLSYAASRLEVLAPGQAHPQEAVASFRGLLRERLSAPDARAAEDFLDRALDLTLWAAPQEPDQDRFGPLARGYLTLVLQGRREDARALVQDALRDGTSIRTILVDVLEAAQREIGRRWQVGEITVAQEHYCTAVTQMVLADLYPYLFTGTGGARRLVAVDAPGSLHQVGLRMVVDLLEHEGWETTHVRSADAEAIVEQVAKARAAVLAISASMPGQISGVRALISAVRADPRVRGVKVLVGGRPFTVAPDLVTAVGADATATSAADAVTVCNRLVRARS
ncbi:cobalamin B12-binding domain-containing protein [Marmoricola sp. RAF53]|uniref:cobalamin B12-binding domain-containing protein n=1 Tax=Marmoricola sp. RAF53 TaxID=3233059 RepID=UPI003F9C18BC